MARLEVLLDLGLGYLSLERSTPTLSPGELQRLRLATQVRSNLFGVVYVLDEPSAGLHPADTEALLRALDRLKASGNSLFVVEHELDVIRHADWIVDVGPAAGEHGGRRALQRTAGGTRRRRGVADAAASVRQRAAAAQRTPRAPDGLARARRRHAQQPRQSRGRASRSASSRPSPACPARASRASSARCSSSSSPSSSGTSIAPDDEEGEELERTAVATLGGGIAGGMEQHQAARARRSEADRPHAAIESRDLHRPVRSRAQAVRRDQGCAGASLRRRALLVQRRQGPLRDLRRRRAS